jgi:PKD repeat protein
MHQTPAKGIDSATTAEIVLCLGGVPTSTSMRIGGRVILGRFSPGQQPVDVDLGVLPGGDQCSPRHACIWRTADGVWWVNDLGSHGGTFLRRSGQIDFVPVTAHQRLDHGDELALANLHLQFRAISPVGDKAALTASQQAASAILPAVAATGAARVDPLRTEKLFCVAAMATLLILIPILFSTPTTTISHTYTSAGVFLAKLQATDNKGVHATATRFITVDVPGHLSPAVNLIAAPLMGDTPLTVDFAARTASDSDGKLFRYDWDFDGDGIFELPASPHTQIRTLYAVKNYDISVRVTDLNGAQSVATVRITVNAPSDSVSNANSVTGAVNEPSSSAFKADFIPASSRGDAPYTVSFDASGSSDSDGRIVFYAWDFDGDGTYDAFSNSAIGYRVLAGLLSMALIGGLLLTAFIQRRVALKRTFLACTVGWGVLVLLGSMVWFISGMLQGTYWNLPGVANSSPQQAFTMMLIATGIFAWVISVLQRDIHNIQHGL